MTEIYNNGPVEVSEFLFNNYKRVHSLFMKISLPINLEFTNIQLVHNLVAMLSKSSVGVLKMEPNIGSLLIPGMKVGVTKVLSNFLEVSTT